MHVNLITFLGELTQNFMDYNRFWTLCVAPMYVERINAVGFVPLTGRLSGKDTVFLWNFGSEGKRKSEMQKKKQKRKANQSC